MNKITPSEPIAAASASGVCYEQLEDLVRSQAQTMIQRILEEEVEELLGRLKSQRRTEDSGSGYRNGYGRERLLSTSVGTGFRLARRRRSARARSNTERAEAHTEPS